VCHGTQGRTFGTVAVILLIEDDSGIRSALSRALTERGHAITWQPTGMAGLQSVIDDAPEVVLLDLGLPDVDGLQVLSMLRSVSHVPVIIVTARGDDTEVIKALDSGADDFVAKPFGADHLDARIRAVLRRSGPARHDGAITVGGLVIDARAREAHLDGATLELSRKEFDLLLALAQRAGEVVTKRELLAEVWRQPYGGGDRTVDVHLSWLRRKLGETAAAPRYLRSTRGVGIRLAAPDTD
jgi:DNA-binding response OmpR family regulator